MTFQRFIPHLAVVTAITLTGCAITKIDVDVYKGPLANHEEVQIEQLAVMAIGARPILMRLRDRLEDNRRDPMTIRDAFGPEYGTCLQEDGENENTEDKRFLSDDARRVNAILCLYEDQDRHLERLRQGAWDTLRGYRTAWDTFRHDNEYWEEFKLALYDGLKPENKDSKLLPHSLSTICSDKMNCRAGLSELAHSYEIFLRKGGPPNGAAGMIRKAHEKIYEALGPKTPDKLRSVLQEYISHKGANWNYRFLSNKDLVTANAAWLFDETRKEAREKFVSTVMLVAKSFRSARSALRDLLQINLDMLLDPELRPHTVQAVDRRKRIAKSISVLIGLENFRTMIRWVEMAEADFSKKLQGLAGRVNDNSSVVSDSSAFRSFLVAELTRQPLDTTLALKEADLVFPSASLPSGISDKLKEPTKREFGLARVIREGEDAALEKDIREVTENLAPEVTGLAGGRLSDGLERMIEDYLNQDDSHKNLDGKEASTEIHRLRDALVRFAQKILFLANYDSLLSRDGEEQLEDPRIREYTQVLQAVGNTILNHANELQARKTHGRSQKEGVHRARYSASKVLAPPPQQTIAAVIDKLVAERADPSSKVTAAAAKVKKASIACKAVAKMLNPYVVQDSAPTDEDSCLPNPSQLTDTTDSPLELAKRELATAEQALCDAFTPHVIRVISARVTLTSRVDQGLYDNIRSHTASMECNSPLAEAQRILKSHHAAPTKSYPEPHAQRVKKYIDDWQPKDKDGKDVPQDGVAIRQTLIDFMPKLQKEIPDKKDPDYTRLENAIEYLPTLPVGAIAPGRPDAVFDQIRNNVIGTHWSLVDKKLSGHFAAIKAGRAAVETQKKTRNGLMASYAERHAAWTDADRAWKTLTGRIETLNATIEAINSLKASVVAKTLSVKLPVDPSDTFLLLKTTVADNLDTAKKEGDGESIARWQAVFNELDRINPPSSAESIRASKLDEDKTSRQLLDRLVSVLEYEHIEAIKIHGAEATAVNKFAAALRAAYQYRARLAFIRPASSYLRSSYPTASLQNNPNITWRNELKRHFLKGVPVFGGIITREFMDKRYDINEKVVSQIDRQFWQNINSIRVGGAGRTNYVMVQDDIGNWYVKGYSADTQDIIKSATGLGQLALGRSLDTDLVNRPEPGTDSAPGGQPTALEILFNRHKTEYQRATSETFLAAQSMLTNLPSTVTDAWRENSQTVKVHEEATEHSNVVAEAVLTVAVEEFEKDERTEPEQVALRPARIAMALRAMNRYRVDLSRRILDNIFEPKSDDATTQSENPGAGTAEPPSSPSEPATPSSNERETAEEKPVINAVVDILNGIVGEKIEHLLSTHESSVKSYENAIVFLGEASGQAVYPSETPTAP